jgi:hypothetical protein
MGPPDLRDAEQERWLRELAERATDNGEALGGNWGDAMDRLGGIDG